MHHGHCFIDRKHGMDNHRRLSHEKMTLWAKKISLRQASVYGPPHCLEFDRTLSKQQSHTPSTPSTPSPPPSTQPSRMCKRESLIHSITPTLHDTSPKLPAKHFDGLLEDLWLAEILTIDQILMVPLGSLSKIGGMGTNHATILKSYAKRAVMSVFGLHGSKDELAIDLSEVKGLPVVLEKKRRHNKSLEVIKIGSDGSELELIMLMMLMMPTGRRIRIGTRKTKSAIRLVETKTIEWQTASQIKAYESQAGPSVSPRT
ncbi:hypothetical protein SERLA73DRAFT_148783 [Serpula lacrymans var. lacrymans S7.3]|uniref:Uncharacterized protein n=1 Tax=Serpula lacrymans var. lacrymans (strain S7.3) TaxID=936435 RepID=F8PEU0_SERL3|nr:hypothetical protein SERLA73DRAFT_148783 [Serpula lacrymans var. lacrymans S7.3]